MSTPKHGAMRADIERMGAPAVRYADRRSPGESGESWSAIIDAIDGFTEVLNNLRERLSAERVRQAQGDWIGQKESPIPARVFTRHCRELIARGDKRAAVRGRVHYIQRAALDEFLRGSPQPKKRVASTPLELLDPDVRTAFRQFQHDLDVVLGETEQ